MFRNIFESQISRNGRSEIFRGRFLVLHPVSPHVRHGPTTLKTASIQLGKRRIVNKRLGTWRSGPPTTEITYSLGGLNSMEGTQPACKGNETRRPARNSEIRTPAHPSSSFRGFPGESLIHKEIYSKKKPPPLRHFALSLVAYRYPRSTDSNGRVFDLKRNLVVQGSLSRIFFPTRLGCPVFLSQAQLTGVWSSSADRRLSSCAMRH